MTRSFFGQHEVRYERDSYVTCRIDVSPLVRVTPEMERLLRVQAQRRADDVARRDFYRTHVLDTPQGRLANQIALCRIQGYTTERLLAAASTPKEPRNG